MKKLISLLFIISSYNQTYSYPEVFIFNHKEDEKDVNPEIIQTLSFLSSVIFRKSGKNLYIDKVEDGIVYIDKSKYTQEEINLLQAEIEDYVAHNVNPKDKLIQNALGFDSGTDSDWVNDDFDKSDLSRYNIKIDSTWIAQELTTLSYLSSSDIVYKKNTNIPVNGVVYKVNHDNDRLEFTVEYIDGKKHGEQKQYSSLGFMNEIEHYNHGEKEWAGARYSQTGMIKYMATNPDAQGLHFVAEYFYESTVESNLTHYLNGKMHGHCLERYAPNQMKFEGDYDQGKAIGLHKYWYSNGNKEKIINYSLGKYHGLVTYYFENGQIKSEGNYINGVKDGTHLEFYENGQLMRRENYKNGKKDGLFEDFYKNGQLKSQGSFSNDLETGTHKDWYENNGQLNSVATYVNGKVQGKAISYHENGTKSAESETINGARTTTTWYSDGTKSSQVTVVNYKYEGVCYEWYPNGQMKSQTTYKANKKNGIEKVWYSNGNLKYEKRYINDVEQY